MDDNERLERIQEVLDRLEAMSPDHVLLVEGRKDKESLSNLGIDFDCFMVQSGGGPVKASEYVWKSGKRAVILTDWDDRGGNLAQSLRENLSSLGVGYDDKVRSDLAFLTRPFSKDVESLDSVVRLLLNRRNRAYDWCFSDVIYCLIAILGINHRKIRHNTL